jgi:hypothetical protein
MRRPKTRRRNEGKTQARKRATRKSLRKRTGPSKNSVAHTDERSNRGRSETQKRQSKKSVRKTKKKIVRIPTLEGTRAVAIRVSRHSRQTSTLGKYWNAVHRYLQTGDASRLKKFRGKHITDVRRVRFPLLTDTDELDRLGSAGVLSFESLYARST